MQRRRKKKKKKKKKKKEQQQEQQQQQQQQQQQRQRQQQQQPAAVVHASAEELLAGVRRAELARLPRDYQLSRAATELCCVLFALVGALELCMDRAEHDACLETARVFAFGYRSDRGTYSLTEQQRGAMFAWSHRVTASDPNFVDNVLAPFRAATDVTETRLAIAKAIVARGDTHRSDFATRIRSSLTKSHVYLLRWCEEMIRRRDGTAASLPAVSVSPPAPKLQGFRPRPKSPQSPERTSLAFPFLETIPKNEYRQTLADTTMAKQLTHEKLRAVYGKHYPGKNLKDVLTHFAPNREVVALRNAQVKFNLLDKPDPPPALDFETLKDLY